MFAVGNNSRTLRNDHVLMLPPIGECHLLVLSRRERGMMRP